jgi:phosphate transport system permease protein|tara:strand:- start:19959 stop:21647 length:1689 start_codon:yes stop_codon:yes gene_type:complete
MMMRYTKWTSSGRPWIWLNAAAIAISILMVVGLVSLLAVRGLSYFWPSDVMQARYSSSDSDGSELSMQVVGEVVDIESVPSSQVIAAGIDVPANQELIQRILLKQGNREFFNEDFIWLLDNSIEDIQYPPELVALERQEWGDFYGKLHQLKENGIVVGSADNSEAVRWSEFLARLERVYSIRVQIAEIEKAEIQGINYRTNQLRVDVRELEISGDMTEKRRQQLAIQRQFLQSEYEIQRQKLVRLNDQIMRDDAEFIIAGGEIVAIKFAAIVRAYRPNQLSTVGKFKVFLSKLGEFLSAEPREANTEGGVFPAIFGTVMMVLLMSVFVTPFGVVAAVYLREYAKQGITTKIIRISVNNLAGVPSIVYGVFGLGFFIYIIGGEIDQLFYSEALPAPTFGTPGLLWASLTLALLTLPVVIVATEEGLARIPRSVREASLALGATKFETLWRVVLPMASPAMMTGLILAVARAAGEVAPLMLVGVVKLAPSLPVDGNYPYLHLDQKFMHLGFHIYDVGFQSSNIEAAKPLVYATAFLLVAVIAALNLSAVSLRNHLREKYKSLEA